MTVLHGVLNLTTNTVPIKKLQFENIKLQFQVFAEMTSPLLVKTEGSHSLLIAQHYSSSDLSTIVEVGTQNIIHT